MKISLLPLGKTPPLFYKSKLSFPLFQNSNFQVPLILRGGGGDGNHVNFEKQELLNSLSTKTLTNEKSDLCENKIRENDLFDSINSMCNNKTSGNNGLTKNFTKLSGMNWKLLS